MQCMRGGNVSWSVRNSELGSAWNIKLASDKTDMSSRPIDPAFLPLSHDLPPPMDTITYRAYSGEHELPHIISLVQGELSEPYVVYTYRYFLHQWSAPLFPSATPHSSQLTPVFFFVRPHLSFLVRTAIRRSPRPQSRSRSPFLGLRAGCPASRRGHSLQAVATP